MQMHVTYVSKTGLGMRKKLFAMLLLFYNASFCNAFFCNAFFAKPFLLCLILQCLFYATSFLLQNLFYLSLNKKMFLRYFYCCTLGKCAQFITRCHFFARTLAKWQTLRVKIFDLPFVICPVSVSFYYLFVSY